MYKYLMDQEKFIINALNSKDEHDWKELQEYHKVHIEFIQHERLIHLIVTIVFAFFLITSLIFTAIIPGMAIMLLDLVLVIIMLFYILHYYRLENGVERLYYLYDKLEKRKTNQD